MRFHETNDISQNFNIIKLGFSEVWKYFVDFGLCFWYFRKMTPKFQFRSYRFGILKFELGNGESSKNQYHSYLVSSIYNSEFTIIKIR
jgi:hypothetical protein